MKQSRVNIALVALVAMMMIAAAPVARAATSNSMQGDYSASTVIDLGARKEMTRDRSGEFQVAGRRGRKRFGKALGIAVGVAATAIIINEAAKAEQRRKRRARARARTRARANARNSRNCHRGLRRHSHRSLGGRTTHRHNRNCVAYTERPDDSEDADIAVAPRPTQRCDPGFEYIDGQCYRNEELDAGASNDRVAGNGSDDAAYERCARAYRSFRYEDGTFQPFGDRPRRLCPYLQ